MADYIPILNSQIEPKAPVTSELMFQLRDNPIATAEGAIGATRVDGRALGGVFLGSLSLSGTTAVGYTSLDRVGFCRADFSISRTDQATSSSLQIRYSNDNGSTYGSWQTIALVITPSGNVATTGSVTINLQTGNFTTTGMIVNVLTSSGATTLSRISGSGGHTVPSDCNAFQVSLTGSGSGDIEFCALGGLE